MCFRFFQEYEIGYKKLFASRYSDRIRYFIKRSLKGQESGKLKDTTNLVLRKYDFSHIYHLYQDLVFDFENVQIRRPYKKNLSIMINFIEYRIMDLWRVALHQTRSLGHNTNNHVHIWLLLQVRFREQRAICDGGQNPGLTTGNLNTVVSDNKIISCYLPRCFLSPYESIWKGFESDQRRLTLLVSIAFACLAHHK